MALYKESFATLTLFVWVFYVGSGILGMWSIAEHVTQFGMSAWDPLYFIIALVYALGGLYFAFNAKKLLPKQRTRIIQAVTTLFLIDVALVAFSLVMSMIDPAAYDPTLLNDPEAWKWMLAGGMISVLFSFAIYLVIVHAINTVSGVVIKQSKHLTIAYWIIVIVFLGLMLTLLSVGSFEGM